MIQFPIVVLYMLVVAPAYNPSRIHARRSMRAPMSHNIVPATFTMDLSHGHSPEAQCHGLSIADCCCGRFG